MNALELRRRTLGKGVYKKTVEGNPAIAQGSLARRYPGITMQGWTEQAQYEGNQLLHINIPEQGLTNNGITIVPNSYGGFRVTGSTGENVASIWIGSVTLNAGTYTLSGGDGKASSYRYRIRALRTVDGGFNGDAYGGADSLTQTLETDNLTSGIYFQAPAGVTLDDDVYPMLNEGSTALPYEPYTGGQPSPNPDYPQEIVSAGNYDEATGKYQYEVKLTGKNLWDTIKGSDTSNWVGSTSQSGYSDFAIDVSAGKKVTVSFPEKLPTGKGMYVGIVLAEDGNIYKWMYHSTQEHLIFQQQTVTAVGDKIWIRCNNGSVPWFSSDNPYFQIEYGEERTDFQPYKEQTVTLTANRPLTKWDRLEKRAGQWGWVYKSAEIVCDGSETWFLTSVTSDEYQGFALRSSDYNAMKSNLRLVCDRFAYSESNKINTCKQDNSEYGLRFVVSTEYVPNKTVAEFKNWLQSNPITVLYHLAEPVFTPLSEAEQEQMNALHTFRPTTVLSNDAGCEMSLTYKTKKSLEVTT